MSGAQQGADQSYDLVLRGGRVIDPESGLDAVRDVAVNGRHIACISSLPLRGRTVVNVSGLVVSPGFIDLHSHAQGIIELRLQALDGVTTALDLECGAHPVEASYRHAEQEGRPIHFGFSSSWAIARLRHVAGIEAFGGFTSFLTHVATPGWEEPASAEQVRAIVDYIDEDLSAGAVGVGVLLGYVPDCEPAEYLSVAALAASRGAGVFTHARDLVPPGTDVFDGGIDGVGEVVRVAAETGAHIHICHVNSTSLRQIDRVIDEVERARRDGSRITAEAYPYGSGMNGIGAAFLTPRRLMQQGLTPRNIRYAPTGERVVDAAHLADLRRRDPAGLCFVDFLREDVAQEFEWVERAISWADTAIASDAIPLMWAAGRPDEYSWPPPAGGFTHPRGAGTYGRTLRLAREGRLFGLVEAISRCTLVPARILEDSVPDMHYKGRMKNGCYADIVVFDSEEISDQSTYDDAVRPTRGVRHLLVDGVFVVRDGELRTEVLPGRPVRAHPSNWGQDRPPDPHARHVQASE